MATPDSASPQETITRPFQADVSQVLRLVVGSLYSHPEVFLRELVSNASDALDKLRFRALTSPDLLGDDPTLEIRIHADKAAGTLTIEDSGIGMTDAELIENLGTIAHSGSRALLEALAKGGQKPDLALIGQFGVGFYSAFLVADRVEVTSLAAGKDARAFTWSSDAKESYTLAPAARQKRGTEVVLHLQEQHKDLLDPHRLEDLVRRYSDYVAHPILVGDAQINRASAIWQRPKSEVTQEQYDDLYKHLTHDFEAPLGHTHFRVEGTQEFVGLLYLPKRAPFDLYDTRQRRGIRLFVRRVFILDDCEELLPPWLRFVRGVVDSDDLPLNVSREMLQDSQILRAIQKQVTRKTLDLLDEIAKERPDDYATFWRGFGAVLKEGLAGYETDYKDRLAALLRYESTHQDGALTSLADYVSRMKDGQPAIYYAFGESKKSLAESPYLEALRARGYEVLYLTDPGDEWAAQALGEFDGKKLVSSMQANLSLNEGDDEATKKDQEAHAAELKPVLDGLARVLGERVREVTISSRLVDSPCCLVLPGGATPAYLERLLRERGRSAPHAKRILELNPGHPLVQRLNEAFRRDPEAAVVRDLGELLYDQALLAEGSVPEDANGFAKRITNLLLEALPASS